jgi:riboflavin biosynthesis pyrimidine reductase
MGLLRACADAVLVGAETMRDSPGTLWTADQAYPPAAALFDQLRQARTRPPRPAVAVLSGHGTVDPRHPAFEQGALMLTSEVGAARLRNKLPQGSTTVTIGPEPHLDPAAAVTALRARGHRLILCEGGPTVFGALLGAGLVDEVFLTTSPVMAGRTANGSRQSLVEGIELLPATTVGCELLSLRRAGSHLLSRYRMSRPGIVDAAS